MIIIGKSYHAEQCTEALPPGTAVEYFLSDELDTSVPGNCIIGFVSIPRPRTRQDLYDKLKEAGWYFINVIHPSAIISPSATIKEGVQVHAGAIIQANCVIGENCIINTGAIVSHDCILGKNVHLAPGATLAGNIHIGDNSLIGMNATVYFKVELPQNTIIANGRNVLKIEGRKVVYI